MKETICTVLGLVFGYISSLFGGWDAAISTLVCFMAMDYITGLIVAGVFHKSGKTKSGALESGVGWRGLCRKGMTLAVVLVACRLDTVIGSNLLRDAAVIGFIVNETISIAENAGLMGVQFPEPVMQAIEILKKKADGGKK